MRNRLTAVLLIMLLAGVALPQEKAQKPSDETPIRISTELVQLDVVVVDKNGRVVRGLTKDDFTVVESGKRQPITFFDFVDTADAAGVGAGGGRKVDAPQPSPQGLTAAELGRIFAFVVDDLTVRPEDMVIVRQLIGDFIDRQMKPTDLVGIVRTVGGKGLLQQLTSDKELLRRAVAELTPSFHPYSAFNNPADRDMRLSQSVSPVPETAAGVLAGPATGTENQLSQVDIIDFSDETLNLVRAYMSLSTAGFLVDSMRELPGRKSLVLISGGLPILNAREQTATGTVTYYIQTLTDKAARAGVAIHTMDVRGLQAMSAVASFTDTPGRSMLSGSTRSTMTNAEINDPNAGGQFRRGVDESLIGNKNPFDSMDAQQGLRMLAATTGGIASLNKNDFHKDLQKIVDQTEAYYLLAYTPEGKFDGSFRKVDVKVRGDYRVYSRRGFLARDEQPEVNDDVKARLLAAIRAPLARRDIDFDAMLLYKGVPPDQGAIDIHLTIDPAKLKFEEVDGKRQASFEVAGFVYDERGDLRGGFSETITPSLTPEEFARVQRGGFAYSANANLPAGIYQLRLAVRDARGGGIGTLSRYLEVPDLSKGRLNASSLLIGGVPPGDTKAATSTPITANRQISRTQDLRYAVVIYNAKLKDGAPQVRTQLVITQNGKELFREPEQPVQPNQSSAQQIMKVGQLGLSRVPKGRYTLTLIITDPEADKKYRTLTRSMDFVVVD